MGYYETKFRDDLLRYCEFRSDLAFLGRDHALHGRSGDPGASRHIRFGTSGWEPENGHDFYFSLYFTVLTDMGLHAHFPTEHATFDRLALSPKLFGMGVTQRVFPSSVLYHIQFRQADLPMVERLWRSYCIYFIRDWQESLLRVCGVDGLAFLRELSADPDLMYSAKLPEPAGYLESILLDLIRDEVHRLDNQTTR